MKDIEAIIVKDDLKYTQEHEWIKVEKDDLVKIGITDYAQDRLSDIVFVEFPEVGDSFEKEEEFGTVESVKAVSEVYMPISGEVVEINEALEDEPELVNHEPYDGGWLIIVKVKDISQIDSLMDKKAYIDMLKG